MNIFKHRQVRFFKEEGNYFPIFYIFLLILNLAFYGLVKWAPVKGIDRIKTEMQTASMLMAEGMEVLKTCRSQRMLKWDPESDINQTGLIGQEFSPITTSSGQLEAKRTTLNPNFGGLMVRLLMEAGVEPEDTIAVGASGSFPALIVATLAAAQAMDLQILLIPSLGASQWGANIPDFHWLHMQNCLQQKGMFGFKPIAISLGGERDIGENMEPETRSRLLSAITDSGIPFFEQPDLKKNVEFRLELYHKAASGEVIKAFINIGGTYANLGTDKEILNLEPGIVHARRIPPKDRRGTVFAMADKGIPVIHLLYIKGLVRNYGLPWDPYPLPQPGEGRLYEQLREKSPAFRFIAFAYIFLVVSSLVLAFHRGRKVKS